MASEFQASPEVQRRIISASAYWLAIVVVVNSNRYFIIFHRHTRDFSAWL